MRNWLWELRYALRQLRRSPGFTVAVVLTLALGIGATTAIFSAVYGLLLKSLPFEDAGRLVAVASTHAQVVGAAEATFLDFEDWKAQQHSFTELAAYTTRNPDTVSMRIAGPAGGRSEQVHRVLASGNLFSLLGVKARLGRTFTAQDDRAGHDAVAVLSATAWQRYFGGDPEVVGRALDLNGASYTVVGVLPVGAAYPAEGEVWLPLSQIDGATRASRVWHSVKVLGRLRPGVTMAGARADMEMIAARLQAAYPATNRGENVELIPLRDQLVGTLRPAMLSLLGAVVLVLLIACVNVASLLLVRAAAQRREMAVRQALGAERGRIFSQYLAQTLVLCLMGGALGMGLAAGMLPPLRVALSHTAGLDGSMIASVGLSWPVLGFALVACVVTALIFGMLPMVRGVEREGLVEALKPGDRGSTGGNRLSHHWNRGALIAGEIAIAVVVLFLGALVMRSYAKLLAVDPGFRTDHLLSAEIWLPQPKYSDDGAATTQFYERLLDRLNQSPGVAAAGTTTQTPLKPSQVMTRFLVEGAPALAPGAFPLAQMRFVSPGFFQTMGLQLKDGRVFTRQDVDQGLGAFVVNEAFAKRYLAGRSAVGRKVLIGVMTPQPVHWPVIGVVLDARDLGVDAEAQPELYMPGYGLHAVVLVRSIAGSQGQDAESTIATLRGAVREIDAAQPIYNVQAVDAVFSDSLARQRMTAVLLGVFAVVALVLAAIGIYGVLSYSVSQRTREIGVRMAVGANRGDVLRMVLWQAGVFAIAGLAIGLGAAIASARLMQGLLFQTNTLDGASIGIALGTLAAVAMLAVSAPAWRAASVNPTEALRSE